MRRIFYRNSYDKKPGYDCRDYYRSYKKRKKTNLSETQFRKIFMDIMDDIFVRKVMKKIRVVLPHRIGDIYLETKKCGMIKYFDGSVVKRDLVNWKKTRELWKMDPSAQQRRIYVYLDLDQYEKLIYYTEPFYCQNIGYYDLLFAVDLKNRVFYELTMHNIPY